MARSRNYQVSRRDEKSWQEGDPIESFVRRQKLAVAIGQEEVDLEPITIPRYDRPVRKAPRVQIMVIENCLGKMEITIVDKVAVSVRAVS